jgi:prepilin-type N-terminal cleavage/methylation domain-containing protein
MRKLQNKGFTIVELLIVIVVIGILALITITTFTGVTSKARNTERQSDIKAIHGQLEAYKAENGFYPALADLNDSAFLAASLKGLDTQALRDPQGTSSTVAAAAAANVYSYTVGNAVSLDATAQAACVNTGATPRSGCTFYNLTATLENGAGTFSKTSLQ